MDINKIFELLKLKSFIYPFWIILLLGQIIIASIHDWAPIPSTFTSISEFASNVEGICLEENGIDECLRFQDNKTYNAKIEIITQKYKSDNKIVKVTPAKE